jgi:hypothetical protein
MYFFTMVTKCFSKTPSPFPLPEGEGKRCDAQCFWDNGYVICIVPPSPSGRGKGEGVDQDAVNLKRLPRLRLAMTLFREANKNPQQELACLGGNSHNLTCQLTKKRVGGGLGPLALAAQITGHGLGFTSLNQRA